MNVARKEINQQPHHLTDCTQQQHRKYFLSAADEHIIV
jgi:hypothetical protein